MDHLLGHRDGETYEAKRDKARLNRQALAVYDLMRDQRWRTLAEIAERTHEPEASVSARLRDLRKPRFGAYVVEREYAGDGQWRYRVLPPETKEPVQLELLEA